MIWASGIALALQPGIKIGRPGAPCAPAGAAFPGGQALLVDQFAYGVAMFADGLGDGVSADKQQLQGDNP